MSVVLPESVAEARLRESERQRADLLGILALVLEQAGGEVVVPPEKCAPDRALPEGELKWEWVRLEGSPNAMRVWWERA